MMVSLSGGQYQASIYSDGGTKPGSALFTQDFAVPSSPSNPLDPVAGDNNFRFGFNSAHWNLLSGTYWLVFSSSAINESTAYVPIDGIATAGSDFPLTNLAYRIDYTVGGPVPGLLEEDTWHNSPVEGIALQIFGAPLTTNPVPEPGTVALGGLALAALTLTRRRRDTPDSHCDSLGFPN